MGQKVHPIGIRLGITKEWSSKWYADSQTYSDYVYQDQQIREFLKKKLKDAFVSRIQIDRPAKRAGITIHDVRLNISEIRKPELDAQLVAEGVAQQLERRVQFRRAMRRAVTNTMRIGAEGIKVKVSGRMNGAEIARSEWYREGRVPLHTFRADIDYGLAEAKTTYGVIGVKVWVFRGEVFDSSESTQENQDARSKQ